MADDDEEALQRRRRKLAADRLALEEEELEFKRRKLERDRQALEAQEQSGILRLNVGGQIFAKYATRGFAVAVPGLELERVASRYKDGVFAWAPGRNLRRLSLTFGGADTPTYSVGTDNIVGLPKLLVLSSLRGSLREEEQRERRYLHNSTLMSAVEEGAGTFIIDLARLGDYGQSTSDVWRKPTPPAPPPTKLTRHNTRGKTIAGEDAGYEGLAGTLLVYREEVVPSGLQTLLGEYWFEGGEVQYVYEMLMVGPDGEWRMDAAGGAAQPAINQPLSKIEDAARWHKCAHLYTEGRQQKLPRLLGFPASNATGVANPFARMPAAEWFGDVYSR